MIDETTKSLINLELDGSLSEREQKTLEKICTSSPEARAFRDHLQQMNQLLMKVEDEQPPAHLKQHIMNTIRSRQTAATSEMSALTRLADGLSGLFQPKVIVAFSLGCVATLCVYALFTSDWNGLSGNEQKLVGTIYTQPEASTTEQTFDISAGEAAGTVRFSAVNQNVTAEIAIAGGEFEFTSQFSPEDLKLVSIQPEQAIATHLDFSSSEVTLRSNGETTFIIVFQANTTEIPLRFNVASGGSVQKQEILLQVE